MSKKQTRKLVATILLVILAIFALERIYNSRSEFNVKAEEASYYDVIEVGMTTKEKLQDFEYMYDILKENYPFFEVNKRLHNVDWLGNKSKYKRLIKNTKTDTEYLVAMSKILGDLHNPHTGILTGQTFKHLYKVNYPNWNDALGDFRVMYRYNFNGDVRSAEFDKEPALETKVLVDNEIAYMKINSMSYYHFEEDLARIKDFLKEVEDYEKLIIDIRGNAGGLDDYWKNIVALLIDETHSAEYYSIFKENTRNKYDTYKLKDIRTVNDLDESILNQFPEEIKTDFKFYKLNTIQVDPLEEMGFNGKVYLLVDSGVFSSAEKFASFAKDTGFATLVGETTGGDRTFEDIPVFYLRLSKFVIRYSIEMSMNADGTINMETRTTPHIQVDPTPNKDFTKDECIQAVINDN